MVCYGSDGGGNTCVCVKECEREINKECDV